MSINPKLLQKRLSDVRWHLNMSSDVDSNLYAAVDGLTDIVGDLITALTPPPAAATGNGEPLSSGSQVSGVSPAASERG